MKNQTNNTNKVILGLIEILRGESAFTSEDAGRLVVGLLAWRLLSDRQQCAGYAFDDIAEENPRQAEDRLLSLDKGENGGFAKAAYLLGQLGQRSARMLLNKVGELGRANMLSDLSLQDAILAIVQSRTAEQGLPAEVCDLLAAIGNPEGRTVYLPWEPSGQLLGRAVESAASCSVESNIQSRYELASLVRATQPPEKMVWLSNADPLTKPQFLDADGALRKFQLTISAPPFGLKVPTDVSAMDRFGRFPEVTTSGNVLAIQHLISQTRGRVVALVSNSVLFASSAEKKLRRELIDSGMLEMVVGLPPGLLPGTTVAVSVLVLDTLGGRTTAKMVSVEGDRYKVAESKSKFTLSPAAEALIADVTAGNIQNPDAVEVPYAEIERQDFTFLPARYIGGTGFAHTVEGPMLSLDGDVIQVIRPVGLAGKGEKDVAAFEVTVSDIDATGYLTEPKKQIPFSSAAMKPEAFVRPHDILVVVKGSIGKVGIAPANVPPPGPGGWVIGSSFGVVRTIDKRMDPRALAVYLRSDAGQEQILRLQSGAALPFIQLTELRQVKIPMFPLELQTRAAAVLEAQEVAREKIRALQSSLEQMVVPEWQASQPE